MTEKINKIAGSWVFKSSQLSREELENIGKLLLERDVYEQMFIMKRGRDKLALVIVKASQGTKESFDAYVDSTRAYLRSLVGEKLYGCDLSDGITILKW